jgi:hypothetical protein
MRGDHATTSGSHFNVHFAKKLVCTKPNQAGYPQR